MPSHLSSPDIARLIQRVRTTLRWKHPEAPRDLIDEANSATMAKWWRDASSEVQADYAQSLPWVLMRSTSALIDLLRRQRKLVSISSAVLTMHSPDEQSERFVVRQETDAYLGQLGKYSYEQVVSVVYHDLYGYPIETVAGILQCSVGAAFHHHKRAIQNLRKIAKGEPLPIPRKKREKPTLQK